MANADTRNKRASCLTAANPCMGTLGGNPDGLIAQADRQQMGYIYAGIAVGSTLPDTTSQKRHRQGIAYFTMTSPPILFPPTFPVVPNKA